MKQQIIDKYNEIVTLYSEYSIGLSTEIWHKIDSLKSELSALESQEELKPTDQDIKRWIFFANPVCDNDTEWDYGFRQGEMAGAKAMRNNMIPTSKETEEKESKNE